MWHTNWVPSASPALEYVSSGDYLDYVGENNASLMQPLFTRLEAVPAVTTDPAPVASAPDPIAR